MAALRVTPAGVALVAAYTVASSALGLTRGFVWVPFFQMIFVMVWSTSLVADAVFVLGSAAGAVIGYRLAANGDWGLSVVFSAAIAWLTYGTSFALLGMAEPDFAGPAFEVMQFVGGWGTIGLGFATAAPPLAALGALRCATA